MHRTNISDLKDVPGLIEIRSNVPDNDVDLSRYVSDMSNSAENRIRALEKYCQKFGMEEAINIVNRLITVYQLSGIKRAKLVLCKVCRSKIPGLLKSLVAEALYSYKKDATSYEALNQVCLSFDDSMLIMNRVRIICMLMLSPDYVDQAQNYLNKIITDLSIDTDYRYRIILKSLPTHIDDSDQLKRCLKASLWVFLHHEKTVRYRVLASQYLLQKCDLDSKENGVVEDKLLSFCTDNDLDYNIRADAADILLKLGSDHHKAIAKDVILQLGQQNRLTRTLYDNAQNVHDDSIDKSAMKIVEYLACKVPTMKVDDDKDENKEEKEEKENKSNVTRDKKEITFEIIQQKIQDMLEDKKYLELTDVEKRSENVKDEKEEKEEKFYTKKELVQISLKRIDVDTMLYTQYKFTLKCVLVKVWSYIHDALEFQEEMKDRLLEELEEMSGTCSSGFVTRLVNSITGFGDFSLSISWQDQIISNLQGRLNALIKNIDNIEYQENILAEMSLKTDDYESRKHFLDFFRKNMLSIRDEMYQEFRDHMPDTDYDLYFRKAISHYEMGYYS